MTCTERTMEAMSVDSASTLNSPNCVMTVSGPVTCTERTMGAMNVDSALTLNSPNCVFTMSEPMTSTERTMEAMRDDSLPTLNALNYVENEPVRKQLCEKPFDIDSVDIFTLIERDREAYSPEPWEEKPWDLELEDEILVKVFKDCAPCLVNEPEPDPNKNAFGLLPYKLDDITDDLPDHYFVMVNPKTGEPVSAEKATKPYHPYHDHDYLSKKEDGEKNVVHNIESLREDEPDVEVWEIQSFLETLAPHPPVPEPEPVYRPIKKETRRASARTAEIRRREQQRKFSNAVHAAVLKTGSNNKVRSRQFKSIKPKNSVETTPSQSDIEEFYSQPVRQTYSRTTKKKTCKGRIDHSESERHRREVLRINFCFLSDLIPKEYLIGDKVSAQISKQKILNGAKSYIAVVHSTKSSYRTQYQQNNLLRERWQKVQAKLLKSLKRQK